MKNFVSNNSITRTNSLTKASIILALIIIVVYSPVIFLDQTYHGQSPPLPPSLLGYDGKQWKINTIDPAAGYDAIQPQMMLATELIKEGTIPLWNPHMGGGNPLAADSINYIFSPTFLSFLIPLEFWDFGLLFHLWLAGIFTFLFLRALGLNFTSSISGSILYMLSGAFVWYLPHTHIPVMAFTPFILYSLEKLIQKREPKYLVLTSIAFCFGILGSHLESIILQFILVGAYFVYRIANSFFSNYSGKIKNKLSSNSKLRSSHLRKIVILSIVAFFGGLGLSSFIIFPVYELTTQSNLPHGPLSGLHSLDPIVLSFPFVPHIVGTIQSYNIPEIRDFFSWDGVFGFIGIFSLFFSILAILQILKNKTDENIHKYTPLFFLGLSVFFLMKIFGVPIVNWIGTIPILDLISFPRYSGVIIPFGFAIAAAFGIEWLWKIKIKKNILAVTGLISFLIILILSIPFFLYLSEETKFVPQTQGKIQIDWTSFQFLQAGLFILIASIMAVAISQNKSAIFVLVFLIPLEFSIFIPLGLDNDSMIHKSIITLVGMAILTILAFKINRFSWNIINQQEKRIKLSVISVVFIATAVGWVIVSEQSPTGISDRFDFWQDNTFTTFLKKNLGDHRMFSLHNALGPNFPSGYRIDSLAILTPFETNWFASFNKNFLNQEPLNSNLGYHSFQKQYGSKASDIYLKNKKYFDFLGVKYLFSPKQLNFSISSELVPVHKNGSFTLYENSKVFPRVFLVDKYQTAESYTAAQNILKDSNFDLRNEIVIEASQLDQLEELNSVSPESEVSIFSYTSNEVKIKVNNSDPAFLVLTDTYYPGWHAYVDGEETTIYRTNGLVRSIFVPEGNYTVTFSYMPDSFLRGITISLMTAGLLVGFLVYSRYKSNHPDKTIS